MGHKREELRTELRQFLEDTIAPNDFQAMQRDDLFGGSPYFYQDKGYSTPQRSKAFYDSLLDILQSADICCYPDELERFFNVCIVACIEGYWVMFIYRDLFLDNRGVCLCRIMRSLIRIENLEEGKLMQKYRDNQNADFSIDSNFIGVFSKPASVMLAKIYGNVGKDLGVSPLISKADELVERKYDPYAIRHFGDKLYWCIGMVTDELSREGCRFDFDRFIKDFDLDVHVLEDTTGEILTSKLIADWCQFNRVAVEPLCVLLTAYKQWKPAYGTFFYDCNFEYDVTALSLTDTEIPTCVVADGTLDVLAMGVFLFLAYCKFNREKVTWVGMLMKGKDFFSHIIEESFKQKNHFYYYVKLLSEFFNTSYKTNTRNLMQDSIYIQIQWITNSFGFEP